MRHGEGYEGYDFVTETRETRDSYNADTVMLRAGLADAHTAKRISLNTRGLFTFICQSFCLFLSET
jgi:hypothetical protein